MCDRRLACTHVTSSPRAHPTPLAQMYASMGGMVRLMGKPDAVIYEAAMRALGLAPGQVLAVGDSLEHDIAGWVHCELGTAGVGFSAESVDVAIRA